SEYFTGTEVDRDIRLLAGDISNPSIFSKHNPRGIFTVFSAFIGANKEMNALFGNHFQPLSGGSVTTTALDIAVFLGFERIVYVGQDHAFGPEGSHVKGTVYGEQKMDVGDDGKITLSGDYKGQPEPKRAFDHDIHWLDGVDGKKVMSRYDWVGFHQWIVDYVKIHKEEGGRVEMINATEGGAYIDGMEHMALSDVIEKYVEPLDGGEETVEEAISAAEQKPREFDIKALQATFEQMLFAFKTVQSLCEDSLKRMSRIKKSYKKTAGITECGKEIIALTKNENKLIPIFDEVAFLNEAAAKVAYELQSHLKKEKLPDAEKQLMVDMGVTRNKNEAIVKITRLFVPLFLEVLKELQRIKKSGG
ncbi:MAG: motility associated factor glycosyltransferase family protein, partial [Proteobacteria bacterium]|nr:motility associated factor glycosyltransferase family protein [Pseudomonadota bacterium]